MSVIPPIVQYLRLYHLVPVSISSGRIVNHFFSVSVPARYFEIDRIMLDDAPLEANATQWQAIYCSSGQICGYGITKDFDNQYHSLFHADANAAIFVHTYGFSIQNSYAIAGGMELRPISGTVVSCEVLDGCVEEGFPVTVICIRSLDLTQQSKIQVNTEDDSAIAPGDYTALNITENRPNFLPNNTLVYRGGSVPDSVIQFVITTKVDSEDIIEPSEAFLVNVSPVRTAIVLTPQLQVVICPDCAPGYTVCHAGDVFVCISADVDGDCVADEQDNCRDVGNYDQRDRDGDGVGDVCDNCVLTSNTEQENADGDGAGKACDADDNDPGVVATLRLRNVTVKEDVGQAQVCVTVETPEKPENGSMMMCLIDFPFSISFQTISDSAVSPDDFTAQNIIRTFGECTTSLCVNIPIKNDSTLEQEVEVFEVLISLESEASLRNIILTQNETTVFIMDTDEEVFLKLDTNYIEVFEDDHVTLCVSIATNVACAVGFGAFDVEISLSSIEGDVGEDFTYSSLNLSFNACEQTACHMLPIINDDVIERNKSFQFMLQRTPDLDERIKLDPTIGNLTILNDDNVMAVGFSSTTYTTTETIGNVNVCVAVTNPPSGGAVRPFSVTILPGEEESNKEYVLECSRELNFQERSSEMCHIYNIMPDIECELEGKQTYFTLQLGLRSTVRLSIDPVRSTATVTIDDSRESECYVSVWYERTSYTISQQNDNVTICVISTSPGIEEMFTIDITNNRTANSNLIEQSTYSLDFVVNESNSNATECYTISVDFDATDICEYFLCNTEEIVSMLNVDETVGHVQLNRSMTSVIIEPPLICECIDPPPTPLSSSDDITIAATIPSLVLVIAVVGIAVVIIVYRKWTKKQELILKQIQLEE
jgi:hypothetical protein